MVIDPISGANQVPITQTASRAGRVTETSANHVGTGSAASAQVRSSTAPTIPEQNQAILAAKRDMICARWEKFRAGIDPEILQADDERKLELKNQIKEFAKELGEEGLVDSLLGAGTCGAVFQVSSGPHKVAMKFFMMDSIDSKDGLKENLCQLEKDELARVHEALDRRRQELNQPNRFAFVQREIPLPRQDSEGAQKSLVTNIMPGSNIVSDVFEPERTEINKDFLRQGLQDEYLVEYIDMFTTLSRARIDTKDTARSQNTHYHKKQAYLFDFIGTVENEKTKTRLNLGQAKPMTRTLYTLLTSMVLHENENAFYMDEHREKISHELEAMGSNLEEMRERGFEQISRVLDQAVEQGITTRIQISKAAQELERIQGLELQQWIDYFCFPVTQESLQYVQQLSRDYA